MLVGPIDLFMVLSFPIQILIPTLGNLKIPTPHPDIRCAASIRDLIKLFLVLNLESNEPHVDLIII
jgi:hypothetical protein